MSLIAFQVMKKKNTNQMLSQNSVKVNQWNNLFKLLILFTERRV